MEKEKAEVIDFFAKKRSIIASKNSHSSGFSAGSEQQTLSADFEDIFQTNLLKEEKLKKQRQIDNEKVLRSYKIKK